MLTNNLTKQFYKPAPVAGFFVISLQVLLFENVCLLESGLDRQVNRYT
jgi:hypothetical protein